MRPDVLAMNRFYKTPMGAAASWLIHKRLAPMWSAPTAPLYGLGYALPFLELESIAHQAASIGEPTTLPQFALMPAAQGVFHWPNMQQSSTALVDEYHLPIADSSVERMLMVHAIEHCDRPAHLFREIWRVLAPGGQVIAVVPNRRRTWSALDKTPFGHGQPYSRNQLSALMSDQMLPAEKWDTALMVPPLFWPGTARLMRFTEKSLHSVSKNMGGALLVSARKQVYGALMKSKPKVRAQPVLNPLPRTPLPNGSTKSAVTSELSGLSHQSVRTDGDKPM